MFRVFIGLGSNLENPVQQLQQALKSLEALAYSRVQGISSFYQSSAMTLPEDTEPQPDYVNAVACLETWYAPLLLLQKLQDMENRQGRIRTRTWGPRSLDLDMLLYADMQVFHPLLELPHPGIKARNFVLYPLQELSGPDLWIPGQGKMSELLAQTGHEGLCKL